jgi:hypothetical protein
VVFTLPLEEVVEPDLVQRRRRRERRDVTANALFELVGLDHHRERVPTRQALDASLDLAAAGKRRLLVRRNRVDVRRVRAERLPHAVQAGVILQVAEKPRHPCRAAGLEHVVERVEPFARFEGFDLGRVLWCCVTHESSMEGAMPFAGLQQRRCREQTAARPGSVGCVVAAVDIKEGREGLPLDTLRLGRPGRDDALL